MSRQCLSILAIIFYGRSVASCRVIEATSDATYITSEAFLLQLSLLRVADDGIATQHIVYRIKKLSGLI